MKIVMIGQGGHSKVIQDIILSNKEYEIVGYLDDRYEDITRVDNIYFGPISTAYEMINDVNQIKFVIAIGNNKVRKKIAEKLSLSDNFYATLIHKTAVISPNAKIGNGTVVMPHAVINADTRIGNHSIINTGSIVEHDNILGDFVHISPHATLTGSIIIEEGTHIGAAATLIPSVKIGEWSVIGAGAVVINDIPPNCTAVGIPAKVINELSY
ncbi:MULTISPECIES: acetyltransferase [unclassified Bacillus (in: firmicutes)]|uniref:acetyltransferase n=1 Tax=unclassified Bacillus (in: firmicutes) TaxID=185979 RepID=UPI0008E9E160|nr:MULTISPECIES: acetyltransferase [unclassified Bacillus (in: firmicutes)]SFI29279.1 sugar O-acyltransferase, sialic acid O-acetyltransferase NeuD family [Bacillus sp. 71mf]SFS38958.1 sugar O-acyltransferase, sialic acid O-acetyltransferase NeuD family [Bacillus sp. 103mf]